MRSVHVELITVLLLVFDGLACMVFVDEWGCKRSLELSVSYANVVLQTSQFTEVPG